jgi:hypothetical protein
MYGININKLLYFSDKNVNLAKFYNMATNEQIIDLSERRDALRRYL